ncbi:MAG TPA: hypothetical protein VHS78_09465 [Candidatus Elarobacter sp.]|jgi:hypothetical protein|nr:hypothetical protein [Candidatus Elarobacter sp.]
MACDPQTFDQITPQVWTYIQSEIQRQLGITVTSNSGEASAKGFTVGWTYDPAAQALTVTCLDKPFFVPCGVINGQVAKAIDEARAQG